MKYYGLVIVVVKNIMHKSKKYTSHWTKILHEDFYDIYNNKYKKLSKLNIPYIFEEAPEIDFDDLIPIFQQMVAIKRGWAWPIDWVFLKDYKVWMRIIGEEEDEEEKE